MLNWRIEEREYVDKKINEYMDRQGVFKQLCLFHNPKKLNKILNEISNEAMLEFRRDKLDNILNEVREERKRINKMVDKMNKDFNNYFNNQTQVISQKIKPFKLEVKPYDNYSKPTASALESVLIRLEPIEIGFVQEKIDD